MEEKIKIAVIGAFGNMNYGDDLLAYCIQEIFKDNGKCSLFFICENEYVRTIIPKIKLIKYISIPALKPHILLYGGGTQFACFSEGKNLYTARYKKYVKNPLLFINKIRRGIATLYIKKIKTINALGLGIGPFISDRCRKSEKQTKKIIRKMDYIAVRDKLSLEYCNKWNPEKTKLYSDIAYYASYLNIIDVDNDFCANEVAIIVRDWDKTKYGACYIENVLKIGNEFRKIGIKYTYVSFSRVSDKKIIDILLDNREKVVQWNPENCSIKNFLANFQKYNIIITTRYHGAVIATLLNRPFIAINIEPKLEMIAELFNMPKWEFPYETKRLVEICNNIEKNYIIYKDKIIDQRVKQEKNAYDMINYYMKSYLVEMANRLMLSN